jgi:ornithine carbamoyltransferase
MAKRDFLTIAQLTDGEIGRLLDRSEFYREGKGSRSELLSGKGIGLIFEKSSTRTRVSFEMAVWQLAGYPLFLSSEDIQIKRGETIADTARVLSGYLSGLVIRTYEQRKIEEWAKHASVPVINGLTDLHHPCQVLADLFTIRLRHGTLSGLKLAYIGDGNNVAHSLIEAGAKMGIEVVLACPKGFEPDPSILEAAAREAKSNGSTIRLVRDPKEAAEKADILYTDVWVSMGKEREAAARRKRFRPYQINVELLSRARPDALVMHCLPAHRGDEITEEVMEGPRSVIFEQAANRLPVQKAILEWVIGK